MSEPIKYPIIFDKCPNPTCGSTKRVIAEAIAEEVTAGRMKIQEGAIACSMVSQTPMYGASEQLRLIVKKEVSLIIGYYDTCVECGTLYCIRQDKGKAMIDPQMQQQPPKPQMGRN